MRAELPMTPFWFDLLYLDGAHLLDDPRSRRFAALAEIAGGSLIPNLVTSDAARAGDFLDEALARLMLRVENYPKLEGGKRYGDLLEALKGAEYRIAVARRKYNEAVEHYNAGIDLFPNNFVASVTRLGKIDTYFQTPAI